MSARMKSPGRANALKRKATVGNVTSSLQIVMQATVEEFKKRDKRTEELEEKVAILARDLNNLMEEIDRDKWEALCRPTRLRRFKRWWRENVFGYG